MENAAKQQASNQPALHFIGSARILYHCAHLPQLPRRRATHSESSTSSLAYPQSLSKLPHCSLTHLVTLIRLLTIPIGKLTQLLVGGSSFCCGQPSNEAHNTGCKEHVRWQREIHRSRCAFIADIDTLGAAQYKLVAARVALVVVEFCEGAFVLCLHCGSVSWDSIVGAIMEWQSESLSRCLW